MVNGPEPVPWPRPFPLGRRGHVRRARTGRLPLGGGRAPFWLSCSDPVDYFRGGRATAAGCVVKQSARHHPTFCNTPNRTATRSVSGDLLTSAQPLLE